MKIVKLILFAPFAAASLGVGFVLTWVLSDGFNSNERWVRAHLKPAIKNSIEKRRWGNVNESLRIIESASAAADKNLPPNHPMKLIAFNELGIALSLAGRHREAEDTLRKVLEERRSSLGNRHSDTADSLMILGRHLSKQRHHSEAERLFLEAVDIRSKKFGRNHIRTYRAAGELAIILGKQNKNKESEAIYRNILQELQSSHGEHALITLTTTYNLGMLLWKMGRTSEATSLLGKAYVGRSEALGDDHPITRRNISNLAILLMNTGRSKEAASILEKARRGSAEGLWRRINGASVAEDRKQFASDSRSFQSVALSVALVDQGSTALRLAASIVLEWKGVDRTDEAELSEFIRGTGDPETRELAEQLAAQRKEFSTAVNQGDFNLQGMVQDLETTRAALATKSKVFAHFDRAWRAGLKEVQSALGKDEALLEFRTFSPMGLLRRRYSDERLVGVLIRSGTLPILKDLGPTSEIEVNIRKVVSFRGDRTERAVAAMRLSQKLLEPFEDELKASKIIYVSPDGQLNL